MRRLNRSTAAPLGTVFFLFVSLAIIPVSLKAAGVRLGVHPRLSAAIDIWAEVADVFAASYGTTGGSELAALIVPDDNQQSTSSGDDCPLKQYACTGQVEESSLVRTASEIAPMSLSQPFKPTRAVCKLTSRARTTSQQVASSISTPEITIKVDTDVQAFRALEHRKVEAAMQRELKRVINVQGFDQTSINSLPIPRNLRMLIRLKQSATTSHAGAECKARAALDGPVKAKFDRASLSRTPAAPDNCDL